jgi:hypothetical protein
MSDEEAIRRFSGLSEPKQTLVLARFAWELTVLARDGYQPGSDQIANGALVRDLNELQHRVTSAIVDRLSSRKERYPDEVLVRMCVEAGNTPAARSTALVFKRILTEA